jgi:uncharacterized membrane protein YedE/YeeE
MIDANPWLLGGGLLIGLAFGAIVQRQRFCMVAALGNLLLMRDWRHAQAFLAALAVAIAGTQWLEAGALVPVAESAYRVGRFDWLGATAGGLLFGFGAVRAGGCAARTLVRAAEGSLGAAMALAAFAAAAAAAQYGTLADWRRRLADVSAITLGGGDSSVAALLNVSPWVSGALAAAVCAAVIGLTWRGSHDWRLIGGGAAIGGLVVLAWWLTGNLGQDAFAPARPSALAIAGPLARIAHYLVMGGTLSAGFGVPFVTGTALGSAISALVSGAFRWQPPRTRAIPDYLAGGALMGFGAMAAGGCNIGQGLSGVSTLAAGSLLAAGAILAGAVLGVKWLERRA